MIALSTNLYGFDCCKKLCCSNIKKNHLIDKFDNIQERCIWCRELEHESNGEPVFFNSKSGVILVFSRNLAPTDKQMPDVNGT